MQNLIMNNEIISFMSALGFSKFETKVYIKLHEAGPSTLANLVKFTEMPRTTLGRHVDKLIKHGLVTQTKINNEKKYIPETPQKLETLIRDKEILIENKAQEIKELFDKLPKVTETILTSAAKNKSNTQFAVKYYEGLKGVKNAYQEIIESNVNEIFTFLNVDKYFELLPDTHNLFKQFLIENPNSNIYEIIICKTLSKELQQAISDIGNKCICKRANTDIEFQNFDFLIYGDTVIMIQIEKKAPIAITIKSEAISNGLKGLHKMLWEFLPKINI